MSNSDPALAAFTSVTSPVQTVVQLKKVPHKSRICDSRLRLAVNKISGVVDGISHDWKVVILAALPDLFSYAVENLARYKVPAAGVVR